MPALLAHDFFAQDAFGSVLDSVGIRSSDERDAFLLGSQGPDPLFYLVLLPPLDAFRELGYRMHKAGPSSLLVAMRSAVDGLPDGDQAVARAYLAGFACHYLLDRTIHPLVYFWERGICQAGVLDLDITDASAVHAEIERDLDEMVLFTKRNQTILAYRPYEEVLRASEDVLNTIGRVYFSAAVATIAQGEPTAVRVFPIAVACYRRALRALYSPKGMKKRVVGFTERAAFRERYAISQAMAYLPRAEATSVYDNRDNRPWRNPFTGEVHYESFWELYNTALDQASHVVAAILDDDFDRDKAFVLTEGLNFSGEVVEQPTE